MPVPGGHDGEVAEGALTPAEEGVAFLVALEFARGVDEERCFGAELIDLNRVVDDEVGGLERIDLLGIAAELGDRVAHRREVHDRGHAGEVLEQHACDAEGDLLLRAGLGVPLREGLDIGALHEGAVLVAEEILEQDLEREGQAGDRRRVELGEVEEVVVLARDFERRARGETVERGHDRNLIHSAHRCGWGIGVVHG